MACCFLQELYPKIFNNTSEPVELNDHLPRLQRAINNLKSMYPFPEERDPNTVISDLISILAIEDWNEQIQRARGCTPSTLEKQIKVYEQLGREYSLIGASTFAMALATMKSSLDGIVSDAIDKGHASEETVWAATGADIHELRKTGDECINALSTVMYKKSLDNVEETVATIQPLIKIAARIGAKNLKSKCDNFLEIYKKKDKKGCWNMIYEIQAERCVVPGRYDTILELRELIGLVEIEIERESGQVYNNS